MYTIQMPFPVNGGRSIVMKVRTRDGWAVATNNALKFSTPQAAADAHRRLPVTKGEPLGTSYMPRIVGPRGGEYHISNGKLWR